ncbi:MAG: hypothetical protein U1G07_22300 [Verrucomicrobiota bacterium]
MPSALEYTNLPGPRDLDLGNTNLAASSNVHGRVIEYKYDAKDLWRASWESFWLLANAP